MKKTALVLSLFLLCSLAGCRQGTGDNPGETHRSGAAESGDTAPAAAGDPSGEEIPASAWRMTSAKELTLRLPGAKNLYCDTFDGKVYILEAESLSEDPPQGEGQEEEAREEPGESGPQLALSIYHTDTGEFTGGPISLSLPGRPEWTVRSLAVLPGGQLSLRLQDLETGEDLLATVTEEGDVLALSEGLPELELHPWNRETWEGDLENYRLFHGFDGRIILSGWDESSQSTELKLYDRDSHTAKPFVSLPDEYVNCLYQTDEDTLCYVGNGVLCLWHIKEQTREPLLSLLESGMGILGDYNSLLTDGGGRILYLDLYGSESPSRIFTVTDREDEETQNKEDEIRLLQLDPFGMEYISQTASLLSLQSDVPIRLEKLGDASQQEEYRTRLLAQLASGEAPELMWVSREDLELLWEKGALLDLRELISQETLDSLFPGVIAAGSVGESLAGIAPEITFYTMAAADTTWEKDTWTLSEFLQVLEEGEDAWEWLMCQGYEKPGYYDLFWGVLMNDPAHTPFLDLEQGVCQFDTPEFARILELCKKYGQPDSAGLEYSERAAMVREGRAAALILNFYGGLREFSEDMAQLGDGMHIVGYPTGEGSRNYLHCEGYLAVNANAVHREEISWFLEQILSCERQPLVNYASVRRDVTRDSVIYGANNTAFIQGGMGMSTLRIQLELKPDGTTYLEDYLAFAESCVPEPVRPSAIGSIIGEEISAYFTGNKDAGEVARIIDNRVQLYLDENG